MRRNLPPTQRYRSQSISCATPSASTSPLLAAQKSHSPQLQHNFSYDMRSETNNTSPTHGRRESLVKPTWQNIRPGQIPLKTLEKINGITSDSDNEDSEYVRRPSLNYTAMANGSSPSAATTPSATTSSAGNRSQAHHHHQSPRKHSGSSLAQLTRKGSLVVHRDSLSHSSSAYVSLKSARSSIDNTSVISATASNQSQDSAKGNKSSGRSLVRMISNKCTTVSSSDEEMDYDFLAKVIMLGDSGVGKTSLLIMFRDGVYMPCYYVTTVGIDFMNKVVVVDGTRVKLQIWDTAGQERFRSVTHAYYRDAHALLLLYDVTNKTTYDNIRAWLCEIRDCAQEDVVIVLIGNKSDCSSSDRQVKREDGERLAREHNVPFMETSAKTGLNVELAFQTVARQLKNRGYENGDDGKFNVHEFVRDNTKAKSICAQCSF